MELAGIQGLKGTVSVPGDKSISHRCIMFGSIANGTTEIHNFLKGADCLATIRCFQSMGINIEETDHTITVHGKGLHGLSAPLNILDVGNSGTTTRLLSGILAGQKFESKLSGDESLFFLCRLWLRFFPCESIRSQRLLLFSNLQKWQGSLLL